MSSEGVLKAFRELPSGKRRIASFLFPEDIFGLAEDGHYLNTVSDGHARDPPHGFLSERSSAFPSTAVGLIAAGLQLE